MDKNAHVETVVLLRRKIIDGYIDVDLDVGKVGSIQEYPFDLRHPNRCLQGWYYDNSILKVCRFCG